MVLSPNEVTLFGWDAYYQIHGPESTCERSAYYDILHPMLSFDTTRDPVTHSTRRKLWVPAFSIKGTWYLSIAPHRGLSLFKWKKETQLTLPTSPSTRLEPAARVPIRRLASRAIAQARRHPIDLSARFEYYNFDLMFTGLLLAWLSPFATATGIASFAPFPRVFSDLGHSSKHCLSLAS